MQLRRLNFAMAAAGTVTLGYLAIAIAVAIAPGLSESLLGSIAQIVSENKFTGELVVTLSGVVAGAIRIAVASFIAAIVFVGLYDMLVAQAEVGARRRVGETLAHSRV